MVIYFEDGQQLQAFPPSDEVMRDLKIEFKNGASMFWARAVVRSLIDDEYVVIDQEGRRPDELIREADTEAVTAESTERLPIGRPDGGVVDFARDALSRGPAIPKPPSKQS